MNMFKKSVFGQVLLPMALLAASFAPLLGGFEEKAFSLQPKQPAQRRIQLLMGHLRPNQLNTGKTTQISEQKTSGTATTNAIEPDSLSSFKSSRYGVGVLPYFEKNGKKYVLLGREVNSAKNEWKEFSGGAELEPGKKTYEHPTQGAAREFFEEIIAHKTLNWPQKDIEAFLDPQRQKLRTTEVIARYGCIDPTGHDSPSRITYVTSLDEGTFDRIFAEFGKAYNDSNLSKEFKEKDALIAINYNDLIAQVKQGKAVIDLSKVEVAVSENGTAMVWSADSVNKAIGKQLVLDPILYRTLRARYATSDEFIVGSQSCNYKRNAKVHWDNYYFYGVQPYVTYQSIEKGFNEVLARSNHTHKITQQQEQLLWSLIADLDLKKIVAINLEVWEQLIERWHTCREQQNSRSAIAFVDAVVKQINLEDVTSQNIARLHPDILRNLCGRSENANYLAKCITPESIKYFDGFALKSLEQHYPDLKNNYKSLIEKVGVCGVPHFVVEEVYNSSQDNKKYIRDLIKKSIDWNNQHDILEFFLLNPTYGMRWLNNLGMLKNDKDFVDGLNKWAQKRTGPLEKPSTQSSQHFFMNSGLVAHNFAYRLLQMPELRFQLMNALKQAKIEEAKGRYVMFHAQLDSYYLAQTIFKKLWNIFYSDKVPVGDDYYFLRFRLAGDNMNFSKRSSILKAKGSAYALETFYKNCSPFGSTGVFGSDTMHFMLSNHNYIKLAVAPEQLFKLFSWGKHFEKYKQEFEALEKLFNESCSGSGNLILLSFTPEQMRSSARLGKLMGIGSYAWITKRSGEYKTTDIIEVLDALKKNPYSISIVNEQGNKEQSSNKMEFYTVLTDGKKDRLLEADGDGILNPYNPGIRMHAFPSGDFTRYYEELDKLFVKIAADIEQEKQDNSNSSTDSVAYSNTLKELAKGVTLDGDDKLNYYYQDCRKLAPLNARITKHDQSKTLRIATYNVHFWRDALMGKIKKDHGAHHRILNDDDMLANIQAINPDVVCLQEVSWDWNSRKTLISKMRKLGYAFGGIETMTCCHYHQLQNGVLTGQRHKGHCFGNALFSKYPLADVSRGIYQNPGITYNNQYDGRGFVAGTVMFNKTPIRIYCTHLDVYDETGQTRKLEVEELVKRIEVNDKQHKNVFITGDFNAVRKRDYQYKLNDKLAWDLIVESDAERNIITPTCVEDTFEAAGYQDAYDLTGKLPPFTCGYGKIVDYGYFKDPKNMTIVCKDVNPYFDRASDHTPIVFDIELK